MGETERINNEREGGKNKMRMMQEKGGGEGEEDRKEMKRKR